MGAYLRKPVTKPETIDGHVVINGSKCIYGIAAVQGWRASMEDAYRVVPDLNDDCIYLGVFDGHGGKEVSAYLAKHLHTLLVDSEGFKNNHKDLGMPETFLKIDTMLTTEEAIKEMQQYLEEEVGHMVEGDDEDDESEEDEIEQLVLEANMSLEDVLSADVHDRLVESLVTIANKGLGKGSGTKGPESESTDESDPINGDRPQTRQHHRLLQDTNKEPISRELRALMEESFSDSNGSDDGNSCEDGEGGSEREEGSEPAAASNGMPSEPRPKRQSASDCDSKPKRIKLNAEKEGEEQGEGQEVEQGEEQEVETCDPEGYESGSTALVCVIRGQKVIVANAGDSRCVLSSKGVAVEMSHDHKPTDPLEQARIEKAGGKIDKDLRIDGGLNLSRAIGDHMYKRNKSLSLETQMITALPDVETRPLTVTDEFLLLASDGIWNCMESQEVIDFVRKKLRDKMGENGSNGSTENGGQRVISDICTELCSICLAPDTDNDGTGCDNMTVVLALLQPWDNLVKQFIES